MKHYYNEFEPYAADWIRNLIREGHIPAGDVDERSIRDVKPSDLVGYTSCHFFAGIAGWALALRLAGWDDSRPVWTGSCPCQPFSVCGQKKGVKDERHLWPEFRRLIEKCRPPVVFGEQVAGPDGVEWLSGVRLDLEACGYAVGGADLPAASVSAPHIRQRLWWVADAADANWGTGERRAEEGTGSQEGGRRGPCQCGPLVRMDNSNGNGEKRSGAPEQVPDAGCTSCGMAVADEQLGRQERSDARGSGQGGSKEGLVERLRRSRPWDNFTVIPCADGKYRRIEPGLAPLAHGVPARMGKLRAYGNAISPQVAAEFISAYSEARIMKDVCGYYCSEEHGHIDHDRS